VENILLKQYMVLGIIPGQHLLALQVSV